MTSTQGLLAATPETRPDEPVIEINVVEDKGASGSASADQVIPKTYKKFLRIWTRDNRNSMTTRPTVSKLAL